MREHLIATYGTFYAYQGQFITDALEAYLEQVARSNMQHRPAKNIESVHSDVRESLARLRVELLGMLGDGSTGQLPDSDLRQAVRGLGLRDPRTVKAYLRRLQELGYARMINPRVWQISKAWVPELTPTQIEEAPAALAVPIPEGRAQLA
jgi:hypothetical protein